MNEVEVTDSLVLFDGTVAEDMLVTVGGLTVFNGLFVVTLFVVKRVGVIFCCLGVAVVSLKGLVVFIELIFFLV